MFGLFRTRDIEEVELCERCGSICDAACRAKADRATVVNSWLVGWGGRV